MNIAMKIEAQLLHAGIFVDSVVEIDHGQQIRLGCGAIVNIYDSGTVLVQGKLSPRGGESTLAKLKKVLPPDSRWMVKISKATV